MPRFGSCGVQLPRVIGAGDTVAQPGGQRGGFGIGRVPARIEAPVEASENQPGAAGQGDAPPPHIPPCFHLELDAAAGRFRLRPRLDYVVSAGGLSWLGCAESGWDAERLRAFVKAGVFDIPDWDGRIYVYQRSVPGGFSVPAFRGRGFFVSWYLYLAVLRAHGLYLTGSAVAYPYDPAGRDGKCSLCIMWKTKF